jgi:hypothetical protein
VFIVNRLFGFHRGDANAIWLSGMTDGDGSAGSQSGYGSHYSVTCFRPPTAITPEYIQNSAHP